MSLKEWAEEEVKIACQKENPDRKDGEWDYGCACYASALKAFNCLLEDEHSGFSIAMTKRILNRLIECKPLTPIEDTTDVWNEVCFNDRKSFYRKADTFYICPECKSHNIKYFEYNITQGIKILPVKERLTYERRTEKCNKCT